MSSGHHHHGMGIHTHTFEKLLKDPGVRQRLFKNHFVNREYDIPYLGGYSKDGDTIFFDRHLPDKIEFQLDGKKHSFSPFQFLERHEAFEKAVMDALGWKYSAAHEAATAYERRAVVAAGLPWPEYQRSYKPYIKADEHEAIKKIPKDLDLRPYLEPPVDQALVARIETAMEGGGSEGKHKKGEVEYSDGHPGSHCGPTDKWPKGYCAHFISPHSCEEVIGYINPTKWCKLFKPANAQKNT